MFSGRLTPLLLCASLAGAVIIDRVAIVAGNAIIKDSDIARDIRLTSFLNGEALDLGPQARKTAGARLLDQVFIRREIRLGDYPTATTEETEQQLESLKRHRFKTDAAFEQSLERYGLTDADLHVHLQWQLSVLRFIDARFRPAAYVSDQEIDKFYAERNVQLKQQFPGKKTLQDLREDIRGLISGEKINQLFFAWLDEQRKSTKVRYLEDNLR